MASKPRPTSDVALDVSISRQGVRRTKKGGRAAQMSITSGWTPFVRPRNQSVTKGPRRTRLVTWSICRQRCRAWVGGHVLFQTQLLAAKLRFHSPENLRLVHESDGSAERVPLAQESPAPRTRSGIVNLSKIAPDVFPLRKCERV